MVPATSRVRFFTVVVVLFSASVVPLRGSPVITGRAKASDDSAYRNGFGKSPLWRDHLLSIFVGCGAPTVTTARQTGTDT